MPFVAWIDTCTLVVDQLYTCTPPSPRALDHGYSCAALHDLACGLSTSEHEVRLLYQGVNTIDVPVKPYHVLLVEEVLHPFYIFQILSVIFWMLDDYYYYSGEPWLPDLATMMKSLGRGQQKLWK